MEIAANSVIEKVLIKVAPSSGRAVKSKDELRTALHSLSTVLSCIATGQPKLDLQLLEHLTTEVSDDSDHVQVALTQLDAGLPEDSILSGIVGGGSFKEMVQTVRRAVEQLDGDSKPRRAMGQLKKKMKELDDTLIPKSVNIVDFTQFNRLLKDIAALLQPAAEYCATLKKEHHEVDHFITIMNGLSAFVQSQFGCAIRALTCMAELLTVNVGADIRKHTTAAADTKTLSSRLIPIGTMPPLFKPQVDDLLAKGRAVDAIANMIDLMSDTKVALEKRDPANTAATKTVMEKMQLIETMVNALDPISKPTVSEAIHKFSEKYAVTSEGHAACDFKLSRMRAELLRFLCGKTEEDAKDFHQTLPDELSESSFVEAVQLCTWSSTPASDKAAVHVAKSITDLARAFQVITTAGGTAPEQTVCRAGYAGAKVVKLSDGEQLNVVLRWIGVPQVELDETVSQIGSMATRLTDFLHSLLEGMMKDSGRAMTALSKHMPKADWTDEEFLEHSNVANIKAGFNKLEPLRAEVVKVATSIDTDLLKLPFIAEAETVCRLAKGAVNKYAVLLLLSKPTITNPLKGDGLRKQLKTLLEQIDLHELSEFVGDAARKRADEARV